MMRGEIRKKIRTAEKTPVRFISISVNSPGWDKTSFSSRRAPRMAIILSNGKAMGHKSVWDLSDYH